MGIQRGISIGSGDLSVSERLYVCGSPFIESCVSWRLQHEACIATISNIAAMVWLGIRSRFHFIVFSHDGVVLVVDDVDVVTVR